jgi:hypothetical protein
MSWLLLHWRRKSSARAIRGRRDRTSRRQGGKVDGAIEVTYLFKAAVEGHNQQKNSTCTQVTITLSSPVNSSKLRSKRSSPSLLAPVDLCRCVWFA